MGIFNWLNGIFDNAAGTSIGSNNHSCTSSITSASGLSMLDNTMSNVAGNDYGADSFIGMDDHHSNLGINPASGLPMMDDSMLDVGGNTFGFDDSHISSFDDSFSTSMFDSSCCGDSDW